MADNRNRDARELRDASRQLGNQISQNVRDTRVLQNATGQLNRIIGEGVQGYRDFNSGVNQTINLFSKLGDLAKSRFKEVGAQLNITTGTASDLLDVFQETVAAQAENLQLSSDVRTSQDNIRNALLSRRDIQEKIIAAGEAEYKQQQDTLNSLDESIEKRLRELRIQENIVDAQKISKTNLETEIRNLQEKADRESDSEEKSKILNSLIEKRQVLAETEYTLGANLTKQQELANEARDLGIQKQELLNNAYRDGADAVDAIRTRIAGATDQAVALTIRYKQFGDYAKDLSDSQFATANVLDKFNAMTADKSRKEFEEQYNIKVQGLKDISKISKEEYDLNFRKASLERSINDATALRTDILKRINEQGGVKTALDEEELALTEEIINQGGLRIQSLDQAIEKLGVVEEYEKRIADENERQKIAKHATAEITSKIQGLLGDSGDEVVGIGKAIKDSMTSPLALVGALVGHALEEFTKLGVANQSFMETSKLNAEQIEHLTHFAHDLSMEYREQGLKYDEVLKSAGALVTTYGTLNAATDVAVEKVSLLGKAFGISAENAAGTVAQLQRSTGVSAETAGNVAALGANFAKAAGVAPDAVMADIATSSREIAKYFKGTPKDLFKTAVEARRLGLNLQTVAGISERLLDFESSIENQMTASVLLGREINLDKARQLAMEGKIQEAAEETLKQVGDISQFNKLNAVQKEAVARAAGMEVADLQKSLQAQEDLKNMTSEQRAEYEAGLKLLNQGNEDAGERLLKEQRNQITQQKIADAVSKIADIFANVILPVLDPIFQGISFIFDKLQWVFKAASLVLRGILLIKAATLLWTGAIKALSFISVNKQLFTTKNLLSGIGGLARRAWTGFLNITGISSAVKATRAFSAAKLADTNITAANTTTQSLNNVQMAAYRAYRAAGIPATTALTAARQLDTVATNTGTTSLSINNAQMSMYRTLRAAGIPATKALAMAKQIDTVTTNTNTTSQSLNTAANVKAGGIISKLGKFIRGTTLYKKLDTLFTNANTTSQNVNTLSNIKASGVISNIGKLIKGNSIFKAIDTTITNSNTLAQVKNALANSSIGKIIGRLGSVFRASSMAKNADVLATNLNTGAQAASIGPTAAAGATAGTAAFGWAALGFSIAAVGLSIAAIIYAISSLATAFKDLNSDQIAGFQNTLLGLGVGLIAFTAIMAGLTSSGIVPIAAAGLLNLGIALVLVGAGITVAAFGVQMLADAFKELPAENVSNLGIALISLAGGLGAIALASIGFVIALPAILAMTGALMLLAPVFDQLGGAVAGLSTGFTSLMESIKSMPATELFASAAGFLALAGSLGVFSAASIGIYLILPAITALTGVLVVVTPLFVQITTAVANLSDKFSALVTTISSIPAETLLGSAAGFISLAGALGVFSLAAVGVYVIVPAMSALSAILTLLNPVIRGIGEGINIVAGGFQNLAAAVAQINPTTMFSIAAAFGSVALALGALSVAIVTTAIFAPAAVLLAGVMMTLGASAIMVGIGLGMAATAIDSITNSLIELTSNVTPSMLDAMKSGLFSLAEGIGAVGFAAIGFTLAIPSIMAFTGIMAVLGPTLILVGTGINSVVTGMDMFAVSINALLPMVDQIGTLASAFSSLALSIGEVGLASLIAFPAMAALGAATSMVNSIFGKEKEEEPSVASVAAPGVQSTTATTTTTTTTPTNETPSIDIEGLMTKLDSLISAVNNQPIQLVVNGKVLAEVVGRNTTRSGAVGK